MYPTELPNGMVSLGPSDGEFINLIHTPPEEWGFAAFVEQTTARPCKGRYQKFSRRGCKRAHRRFPTDAEIAERILHMKFICQFDHRPPRHPPWERWGNILDAWGEWLMQDMYDFKDEWLPVEDESPPPRSSPEPARSRPRLSGC